MRKNPLSRVLEKKTRRIPLIFFGESTFIVFSGLVRFSSRYSGVQIDGAVT